MNDKKISNIKDALSLFIELLRNRAYRILGVKPMNFNRHYLLEVQMLKPRRDYKTFYLIYQRRWFEQFQKYFKIADQACTINLPILKECVRKDVNKIVIATEDGRFYMCNPHQWLKLVEDGGWIRTVKKTKEAVAHLPVSYLERFI